MANKPIYISNAGQVLKLFFPKNVKEEDWCSARDGENKVWYYIAAFHDIKTPI